MSRRAATWIALPFGLLSIALGGLEMAWLSALVLALIVPIALVTWTLRGPGLLGDGEQASRTVEFLDLLIGGVFGLTLVCGFASILSLVVPFRRGALRPTPGPRAGVH